MNHGMVEPVSGEETSAYAIHDTSTSTHLADKLNVFSLDVPHHQDLHLGQEVQSHLIHGIST